MWAIFKNGTKALVQPIITVPAGKAGSANAHPRF